MPSWTVMGVFGIALTTGTPSPRRSSMSAVGMAATMETTVCSGVTAAPISPSRPSMSCGLTPRTTMSAPSTASALSSVVLTP